MLMGLYRTLGRQAIELTIEGSAALLRIAFVPPDEGAGIVTLTHGPHLNLQRFRARAESCTKIGK